MRMSKAFISKWVKRFGEQKDVDDLPKHSGISEVFEKAEISIIAMFSKNPILTLRQRQPELWAKGLDISYETIRIYFLLMISNIVAPSIYLYWENINHDWDNLIFTCEASVWGYIISPQTWSTSIKRFVRRIVKHLIKVHLWVWFSKKDFGELNMFTCNLNAEEILEIHKKSLLLTAKRCHMKRKLEVPDNYRRCQWRDVLLIRCYLPLD